MGREEQIIEMCGVIGDNKDDNVDAAEILYDMGYQKKEEVRKKTAKEIFDRLIKIASAEYVCGLPNRNKGFVPIGILKAWAIEYGVEIDGE